MTHRAGATCPCIICICLAGGGSAPLALIGDPLLLGGYLIIDDRLYGGGGGVLSDLLLNGLSAGGGIKAGEFLSCGILMGPPPDGDGSMVRCVC